MRYFLTMALEPHDPRVRVHPTAEPVGDDIVKARLAAIIESADDAIVSKTLDGVITSWNPAAERIFGWTADEAVGRHITLLIPEDRLPEEDDVLARLRRGEKIDHFETVRRTKEGRLIDISLTVSPIRDASGRVVGASKIARDFTETRRGELARARLAAIVDNSDDAIVSKTLDGIITSWNAGAERIFGWSADEAVGQSIMLIIPPERRAEEDYVLGQIRQGLRIEHFETVRIRKDGRPIDVSLTVSPILNSAGRVIGTSKIARDISERRRMEAERDELLVREQAARARAEALNRTKDEFLATVSHELRTPLNAIFGWARMLESSTMDDAARARALAAIVRSATMQARLVEDLLDLSRIVTGRMRLDFERFDLNGVVDAALDAVRPAATAKNVTLTSTLDRGIGTIVGAPDRLQQVLWNLLMNAIKFTPSGGTVELSVRSLQGNVQIVVSDNGEGIGPELLPHVFEAFRQEDSSSTRAHGGLGLGLALVRQLVELHGGTVRAESPGKGAGATFTVTLPRAASRPDRALPAAADGAGADGGIMLRGIRVLVVDDDADALELASMILRKEGADVRTASSAFRAYEIVSAWAPHVLLSDLAMPGEDGFILLRALRNAFAKDGASLRAIAVTANGTAQSRARAYDAGFERYLTKPIDPISLAAAVADVFQRA